MYNVDNYEVIVIGGGHSGCEGAFVTARMGHRMLVAAPDLIYISPILGKTSLWGTG